MKFLIKYYPVPAVLWGLFILVLASLPGAVLQPFSWEGLLAPDKLAHFLLFAALFLLSLPPDATNRRKLLTVLLGLLYGGIIELYQEFVLSYRSAEWGDLLADGLGLMGGWILSAVPGKFSKR